jgi:hypothetical protein
LNHRTFQRDANEAKFPRTPELLDVITSIAALKVAYEAYFAVPGDEARWRVCTTAHESAREALRQAEVGARVRREMEQAANDGKAVPEEALNALKKDDEILAMERRLAAGMGFDRRAFRAFQNEARKALRKADKQAQAQPGRPTLPEVRNPTVLDDLLKKVHEELGDTFGWAARARGEETRDLPRRMKTADRKDAKAYARRCLYVVGTVVADVDFPFFDLSYALFLGVSAASSRPRRRLRKPPRRLSDLLAAAG